jgi:hypothetical protein
MRGHNCFNNIKLCLFVTVLALAAGTVALRAAPTPSLIPLAGVWQLDFELHGQPHLISITLPGDTQPRRFWYLLYTITNNTGKEVEFYPSFELFTDTFQLTQAGDKVRRPVFEAIRNLYAQTIPLLECDGMIEGRILLGKDNARDSVAIFEDFDPNATWAKIFVAGLSNEVVKIDHPFDVDPNTHKPQEVLLRKTLMLEYQVPGDRYNPDNRVMLYRDRKWIMR